MKLMSLIQTCKDKTERFSAKFIGTPPANQQINETSTGALNKVAKTGFVLLDIADHAILHGETDRCKSDILVLQEKTTGLSEENKKRKAENDELRTTIDILQINNKYLEERLARVEAGVNQNTKDTFQSSNDSQRKHEEIQRQLDEVREFITTQNAKSNRKEDLPPTKIEAAKYKTKVEFELSTNMDKYNDNRSILVRSSIGDIELDVYKDISLEDWYISEKSPSGNGLWIKISTAVTGWQTATIDTPDGKITKRLEKPVIFASWYNKDNFSNGIDLDVMKSILEERFNPKKSDAESINL
jgi:hypothetical protein